MTGTDPVPYLVCAADSLADLESVVCSRITEGYSPIGGLALAFWSDPAGGDHFIFTQAMHRETPRAIHQGDPSWDVPHD